VVESGGLEKAKPAPFSPFREVEQIQQILFPVSDLAAVWASPEFAGFHPVFDRLQ
jgi:hypothetical protein